MLVNNKKSQLEAFQGAAREAGADKSEGALDRIMGKLDLTKKPEPKKTKDK